MEQFQSWNMSIISFCQKIQNLTAVANKLKEELKGTFPGVFSGGLGRCKKMSAKFELKPFPIPEEIFVKPNGGF